MDSTRKIELGSDISLVDAAEALFRELPENHVGNSVRVVYICNNGAEAIYGSTISLHIGTMANGQPRTVPVPLSYEAGDVQKVYLTYSLEPSQPK